MMHWQRSKSPIVWGASLLVGLMAALTLSFLFWAILVINYYRKLTDTSQSLLHQTEENALQLQQVFEELNQYPGQDCNPALLNQMRGAQFKSNFIKDIGFLQGTKLICTTGLGILSPPFIGREPDTIGRQGYHFWFSEPLQLFNEQRRGHIIRNQNFNAVVSDQFFEPEPLQSLEIGIYLQNSQGLYHFIQGTEVDEISSLTKGQNRWQRFSIATLHRNNQIWTLLHFQCGEFSAICVSIYVPVALIIMNHPWELILAGVLILGIFGLLTLATQAFLQHYFSFENCFYRGFKRKRFVCLYQPIVTLNPPESLPSTATQMRSAQSYTLVGVEVLCRWVDQNQKLTSPDQFLPFVHKQKTTLKMTRFVLENLWTDLQTYQDHIARLPVNFKISINICPTDFSASTILQLLEGLPFDTLPVHLCFELTEDKLVQFEAVQASIATLQRRGYFVAIDDFGVGYCNLSYLQELNANFIKIDKIFVSKMEENTLGAQLLPLITAIGRKVGAELIAEGIETSVQAEALLELGVHYGQGYYFGKPMQLQQVFVQDCARRLESCILD